MGSVPKQGLLTAYRRLLKPLVRVLVRNGVTYEEFSETAKLAFLDSAHESTPPDSFNSDHISTLIGLEPKEVQRLIEKRQLPQEELDTDLDRLVALIHEWNTNPEFTGPYGIPLELKLAGSTERPSFSDLVSRHFKPQATQHVLTELLRTKAITETEPGWFRILARAYKQESDSAESIEAFIRSAQKYIEVLDLNIQEQDPAKRMFEREVYTERGIKPENLPRFQKFFSGKAQQLLEEIDNWIALLEPPEKDNGVRTGLTIFHHVQHEDENNNGR